MAPVSRGARRSRHGIQIMIRSRRDWPMGQLLVVAALAATVAPSVTGETNLDYMGCYEQNNTFKYGPFSNSSMVPQTCSAICTDIKIVQCPVGVVVPVANWTNVSYSGNDTNYTLVQAPTHHCMLGPGNCSSQPHLPTWAECYEVFNTTLGVNVSHYVMPTLGGYFGVQNGTDCYCSDVDDEYTIHDLYNDTVCNVPCAGDNATMCGAETTALSIYDINECDHRNGGCDDLRTCENVVGGYACTDCAAGYAVVGDYGCEDINECETNNGGCDPYVNCTNTMGNFTCGPCPDGFITLSAPGAHLTQCQDIDECATNHGDCDALVTCTNFPGSYECGECPPYYAGDGYVGCRVPPYLTYFDLYINVKVQRIVFNFTDDVAVGSWDSSALTIHNSSSTNVANGGDATGSYTLSGGEASISQDNRTVTLYLSDMDKAGIYGVIGETLTPTNVYVTVTRSLVCNTKECLGVAPVLDGAAMNAVAAVSDITPPVPSSELVTSTTTTNERTMTWDIQMSEPVTDFTVDDVTVEVVSVSYALALHGSWNTSSASPTGLSIGGNEVLPMAWATSGSEALHNHLCASCVDSSAGKFTAPTAGFYHVSVGAFFTDVADLGLSVNGAVERKVTDLDGTVGYGLLSTILHLDPGDELQVLGKSGMDLDDMDNSSLSLLYLGADPERLITIVKSSSQALVAPGSWEAVTGSTELSGTAGMDPSTGEWTVGSGEVGWYHVVATVMFETPADGDVLYVALRKNASGTAGNEITIIASSTRPASASSELITLEANVKLETGDVVGVYVQAASGGGHSISDETTIAYYAITREDDAFSARSDAVVAVNDSTRVISFPLSGDGPSVGTAYVGTLHAVHHFSATITVRIDSVASGGTTGTVTVLIAPQRVTNHGNGFVGTVTGSPGEVLTVTVTGTVLLVPGDEVTVHAAAYGCAATVLSGATFSGHVANLVGPTALEPPAFVETSPLTAYTVTTNAYFDGQFKLVVGADTSLDAALNNATAMAFEPTATIDTTPPQVRITVHSELQSRALSNTERVWDESITFTFTLFDAHSAVDFSSFSEQDVETSNCADPTFYRDDVSPNVYFLECDLSPRDDHVDPSFYGLPPYAASGNELVKVAFSGSFKDATNNTRSGTGVDVFWLQPVFGQLVATAMWEDVVYANNGHAHIGSAAVNRNLSRTFSLYNKGEHNLTFSSIRLRQDDIELTISRYPDMVIESLGTSYLDIDFVPRSEMGGVADTFTAELEIMTNTYSIIEWVLIVQAFSFGPPTVTSAGQPLIAQYMAGEQYTATITATIADGSIPIYQWRKDEVYLEDNFYVSGSNEESFAVFPLARTDTGYYNPRVNGSTGDPWRRYIPHIDAEGTEVYVFAFPHVEAPRRSDDASEFPPTPTVDCYTSNGAMYRGSAHTTVSGYDCQAWSSQNPHTHTFTKAHYPNTGLGTHNYCRNPNGRDRPWCLTKTSTEWEYCIIDTCQVEYEAVTEGQPFVLKVNATIDQSYGIVTNGGFEQDYMFWAESSESAAGVVSTLDFTSAEAYKGSRSLEVRASVAGAAVETKTFYTIEDDYNAFNYTASMWIKAESAPAGIADNLTITVFDPEAVSVEDEVYVTSTVDLSTSWALHTVEFASRHPTSHTYRVRLEFGSGGGYFVDEFTSGPETRYQWLLNGQRHIVDHNESTLNISSLSPTDEGLWTCVVTNGLSQTESIGFQLNVDKFITIVQQPQVAYEMADGDGPFSPAVVADASGDVIHYQWWFKGDYCHDDLSTTDSFGQTCSWYRSAENRATKHGACGNNDDDDFVAATMCCACGGGTDDVWHELPGQNAATLDVPAVRAEHVGTYRVYMENGAVNITSNETTLTRVVLNVSDVNMQQDQDAATGSVSGQLCWTNPQSYAGSSLASVRIQRSTNEGAGYYDSIGQYLLSADLTRERVVSVAIGSAGMQQCASISTDVRADEFFFLLVLEYAGSGADGVNPAHVIFGDVPRPAVPPGAVTFVDYNWVGGVLSGNVSVANNGENGISYTVFLGDDNDEPVVNASLGERELPAGGADVLIPLENIPIPYGATRLLVYSSNSYGTLGPVSIAFIDKQEVVGDPAVGLSITGQTLSWSIATNNNFFDVELYEGKLNSIRQSKFFTVVENTTSTSVNITQLVEGQTYTARVGVTMGNTGALDPSYQRYKNEKVYSYLTFFYSTAPPANHTVSASASHITANSVTLAWEAVEGALKYQLVQTSSTAASSKSSETVLYTDIFGTSYVLTRLQPGTTYIIEVRAGNSAGYASTGTPITVTPVTQVTNLSVATVTEKSVTLHWSRAAGASIYQVQVKEAAEPDSAYRIVTNTTNTTYMVNLVPTDERYTHWIDWDDDGPKVRGPRTSQDAYGVCEAPAPFNNLARLPDFSPTLQEQELRTRPAHTIHHTFGGGRGMGWEEWEGLWADTVDKTDAESCLGAPRPQILYHELRENTLYHFRVFAGAFDDDSAVGGYEDIGAVIAGKPRSLARRENISDSFDSGELDGGWQWSMPPTTFDVGVTRPGWLFWTPNVTGDLYKQDIVNRVYQEWTKNFDVSTHVEVDATGSCLNFGIAIVSSTTQAQMHTEHGRINEWANLGHTAAMFVDDERWFPGAAPQTAGEANAAVLAQAAAWTGTDLGTRQPPHPAFEGTDPLTVMTDCYRKSAVDDHLGYPREYLSRCFDTHGRWIVLRATVNDTESSLSFHKRDDDTTAGLTRRYQVATPDTGVRQFREDSSVGHVAGDLPLRHKYNLEETWTHYRRNFTQPVEGKLNVYLRVRREGRVYTAFFKREAEHQWVRVGQTPEFFTGKVQVGLFAGKCRLDGAGSYKAGEGSPSTGNSTVGFEYFGDEERPLKNSGGTCRTSCVNMHTQHLANNLDRQFTSSHSLYSCGC